MFTISNDHLCATVSEMGAELQSLRDKQTGHEYLWQGDARWWGGRSPILFPIVGGLWNGCYRLDGHETKLQKHGFVRRQPWHCTLHEADRVRLEYDGSEADYALFPFRFNLAVTYTLEGRRLKAEFEVKNLDKHNMHFQLGGHPALNLPGWNEEQEVDGYLLLEGKPESVRRAGEQGCLEPESHPVPLTADGLVPLSVATFAHEALIFDRRQIHAATLLDRDRHRVARVESSAPVWLFWSPQGVHTPFVCCEPWYGLCDPIGYDGSFADRAYTQCVQSGRTWEGGFTIEV
ncbi:aldose 1-epimerase family protein [bacterium]|nr:aldose 1-epimerase family protein [bacterium]